MKKIYILIIGLLCSCDNYNRLTNLDMDITPPTLISLKTNNINSIKICFDEDITFIDSAFVSNDNLDIKAVDTKDSEVVISFQDNFIPGKEYCSEFRFEDINGNAINFIAKYYGYNPRLPELLINEFICKGTKTNPDKVELYIKKGGNMAGIAVLAGVPDSYDTIFIFPSINVAAGDYVVVRATSDKFSDEFIEIKEKNYSGDSKFVNSAWDIRTKNLKLSSTNGVISIYSDPFGKHMDSVVYTKNVNNPEKNYRNFGLKKTLERIDSLDLLSVWEKEDEVIFPEDCINIDSTTTTRSANRLNLIDNNCNKEWYIVPTGKSTFGLENSTEVY